MATEQQVISWLKTHERIVLVFMGLLVSGWLGNKWIDSSAEKAKMEAAATAQIAAEAKISSDKAAQASAVTAAQYQQMVDTLSRQNQALAAAITNRDAVLGQKTVEVMQPKTPIRVVNDLNEAYKGTTPSTITADGQVSFDPTIVQKFTVTKIERDTFQSDLADETKVAANVQTELDKSNQLSGTLGQQVSALNAQIVADDINCKAKVKATKAEARAGKIKFLKIGYVAGFISGLVLGHSVGL